MDSHVESVAQGIEKGVTQGIEGAEALAGGLSFRSKLELFGAGVILIAAIVVWALWPPKAVLEDDRPAPQVVQPDHSVIAARAPDAHPAPPPHMLPKGSVEERRESIVVVPSPAASSVQVDLSLVRTGDERRVVASSPDGTVLSAVDIPIEPAALPPPPTPWAAGLTYGTGRTVGLWVDRDVGRLRLGAELQRQADGRAQALVRVGVRW